MRRQTSIDLVYCLGERSVVSEEIARIFFFTKVFFVLQMDCRVPAT